MYSFSIRLVLLNQLAANDILALEMLVPPFHIVATSQRSSGEIGSMHGPVGGRGSGIRGRAYHTHISDLVRSARVSRGLPISVSISIMSDPGQMW